MKAFILSAGLGTRLRPLTNDKPKVMVRIGGKPVLEHLIKLCKHHNITNIVINLHYLPRPVMDYFGDGKKFGVMIEYSLEKEKIMGGAGALKFAEDLIKSDTFIVFNGDTMMNANLSAMVKFHKDRGGTGTFLVHHTDHPHDSDLVKYDKDGLITRYFRSKPGEKVKPVSKSGVHIFEPEVLEYIPEAQEYSLEKELIPDLLAKGKKLYAYYSNCYSKDMGTPKRLAQVKADYAKGQISF